MNVEVDLTNGANYRVDTRPPADVELAVFRIVQEAVANSVQHAAATRLAVRGAVEARHIDIRVVDDGVGIDDGRPDLAIREGHLGMSSMRRRAAAVGATLAITSYPGGTTVEIQWRA